MLYCSQFLLLTSIKTKNKINRCQKFKRSDRTGWNIKIKVKMSWSSSTFLFITLKRGNPLYMVYRRISETVASYRLKIFCIIIDCIIHTLKFAIPNVSKFIYGNISVTIILYNNMKFTRFIATQSNAPRRVATYHIWKNLDWYHNFNYR